MVGSIVYDSNCMGDLRGLPDGLLNVFQGYAVAIMKILLKRECVLCNKEFEVYIEHGILGPIEFVPKRCRNCDKGT